MKTSTKKKETRSLYSTISLNAINTLLECKLDYKEILNKSMYIIFMNNEISELFYFIDEVEKLKLTHTGTK